MLVGGSSNGSRFGAGPPVLHGRSGTSWLNAVTPIPIASKPIVIPTAIAQTTVATQVLTPSVTAPLATAVDAAASVPPAAALAAPALSSQGNTRPAIRPLGSLNRSGLL